MTLQQTVRSVFEVHGNTMRNRARRQHRLKDPIRNSVVVILGEFCGTFMFLFLSFVGAQTALNNNDPSDPSAVLSPSSLLFIACSFGAALTVNVWIFYRVTGGMFNPAVTLGLLLVGAVTPVRAALIIPTQLVAAICAAAVVDGIIPGPLTVGNALNNGTSKAQGVFLEMFLTAMLVITVYFLAVEKHRATFLAPIGIGIAIFICHIAGTNYTGTSVNPARSFGPACIQGFPGYEWIFWLGPFMGSLLAFGVYTAFKWLEYTTANPGQDADDLERTFSMPEKMDKKQFGHRSTFSEASDGTLQAHPKDINGHEGHGAMMQGNNSLNNAHNNANMPVNAPPNVHGAAPAGAQPGVPPATHEK